MLDCVYLCVYVYTRVFAEHFLQVVRVVWCLWGEFVLVKYLNWPSPRSSLYSLHELGHSKCDEENIKNRKSSQIKNTAKLYGDALVWTAVFIDRLDWFELVYYIYDLIGLTLFIWLIYESIHFLIVVNLWHKHPKSDINRLCEVFHQNPVHHILYAQSTKSLGCRFYEILD